MFIYSYFEYCPMPDMQTHHCCCCYCYRPLLAGRPTLVHQYVVFLYAVRKTCALGRGLLWRGRTREHYSTTLHLQVVVRISSFFLRASWHLRAKSTAGGDELRSREKTRLAGQFGFGPHMSKMTTNNPHHYIVLRRTFSRRYQTCQCFF